MILDSGRAYYLKALLADFYGIVDDGLPALRKSKASEEEIVNFMETLARLYTYIFNKVAGTNFTLDDWVISLEGKAYQFVAPEGMLEIIDFIPLRGVMYINVFSRYAVMEALAKGDTEFITKMKGKEYEKEKRKKFD